MKKSTLLLTLLFLSAVVFAQQKKTVHQTFPVNEEALTINLEVYGDYELEPWPGNTIMSETKIELEGAPPHVLKFLMEEKERYTLEISGEGESITLLSKDKERRQIQYKGADCYENVRLKLYVPDDFEVMSDKVLRRKE